MNVKILEKRFYFVLFIVWFGFVSFGLGMVIFHSFVVCEL